MGVSAASTQKLCRRQLQSDASVASPLKLVVGLDHFFCNPMKIFGGDLAAIQRRSIEVRDFGSVHPRLQHFEALACLFDLLIVRLVHCWTPCATVSYRIKYFERTSASA